MIEKSVASAVIARMLGNQNISGRDCADLNEERVTEGQARAPPAAGR
jgi:hypothetical protein